MVHITGISNRTLKVLPNTAVVPLSRMNNQRHTATASLFTAVETHTDIIVLPKLVQVRSFPQNYKTISFMILSAAGS